MKKETVKLVRAGRRAAGNNQIKVTKIYKDKSKYNRKNKHRKQNGLEG